MKITFSFLIINLFFVLNCVANSTYNYVPITVKDGLPSNKVTSLLRDYKGLLWIGTDNGLCCYNGDQINYVRLKELDDIFPKLSSVKFVSESRDSTLWVGLKKHLLFLNKGDNSFKVISLTNQHGVLKSFCVNDSLICFGCTNGVFVYNKSVNRKPRFVPFPNKQVLHSMYGMSFTQSSNIVIASRKGVQQLDFKRKSIRSLIGQKKFKRYVPNRIVSLPNNEYLISTRSKGLFQLHNDGRLLPIECSSFTTSHYPLVLDMTRSKKKVWIATDGDGILVYDLYSKKLSSLKHTPGNSQSLVSNSIQDLFVDRYDNLFVGSVKSGISVVNKSNLVSYKEVVNGDNAGLSNSAILAVIEDSRYRNIWIGTDGGGLNVFNPTENKFIHVPELKDEKIGSICELKPGKLLVRMYRKSSRVFDIKEMKFDNNNLYPWLRKMRGNPTSTIVYIRDNKQRVWKLGRGVDVLDKNGHVSSLSRANGWKGRVDVRLYNVMRVNDYLYLGVGFGGAYHINFKNKRISPVLKNIALYKGKSINISRVIKQGERFWMSSNYGLLFYENNTLSRFDINGVDWESIRSVEKGDNNTLWVGTSTVLYHVDLKTKNVRYCGASEGASCYSYSLRGTCCSRDGNIYMGAGNGLVIIKKQDHSWCKERANATPFVNRIVVDGVKFKSFDSNLVELPWDNKSVKLSFSVNERSFFRRRRFMYSIDGYTDDKIPFDQTNLMLGHLPPGKYILSIWCDLPDGSWRESALKIKLNVNKPWWNHWLFILILGCSVCFVVTIIIRRNKEKNRLLMELDLEKKRKEDVTKMIKQKDAFLTNVSHELRTPLTLIYGPIRRMLREVEVTPVNFVEHLKKMDYQATKMKNMVDNVIEFQRLDSKGEVLSFSTLHIHFWLECLLDQFEDLIKTKNLSFHVDFPENKKIELDFDKLEVVISNLIVNAIKYSPERDTIDLAVLFKDQKIYFYVKDNGPGIDPNHLVHIFKPFYQGENSQSGYGVGLSYAKRLIGLMNGTISVLNTSPIGAKFEVAVPYVEVEEEKDCVVVSKNQDAEDVLGSSIILLVEEDRNMIEYIQNILGNTYKLIIVSNGNEGWHHIVNNYVDLVITDIEMSLMNDSDLCLKIKSNSRYSHIPVLILSAKVDYQSKVLGFENGADLYLSKPFDGREIKAMVQSLLRNRNYMKKDLGIVNETSESLDYNKSNDVEFQEKITMIIQNNLHNPYLDASFIQSELKMSRSSLYVKFKSVTGKGVSEFIRNQRITQASSLLRYTDQTVREISSKVGFENQRYFSTVFKEQVGCTPSKYRLLKS
ncbi:helix-turn-helix domain-containing protein [Halosquirtibacter xylanolyticus]|uniref:ATP-binding protein n=1 Tax=Halosquirtibacter xylanolyticus TaxID=3374599 RepID=UPI003748E119|nr:helix-turn-helix domain-containing protein [Prolixibacteraceae bacterium]